MREHILDELSWRGLIAQSTDLAALRAELDAGPVTLYAGLRPDRAEPARRQSRAAADADAATSGPGTGRSSSRAARRAWSATRATWGSARSTPSDVVAEWAERIRGQLERFVDFDGSPTGAIVANNLEWTGGITVLEFLRDVGKHFSINVMLARETVRRRLDTDGMSFTEFSYLLLQSYDYLQLYRKFGCALQVGGSDQWGNILGGVELVRRVDGDVVHAMTTPLVTDAEGRKFGKSTGGGNVWLDPALTSPYAWYQYFVNVGDADVVRYLRMFTFLTREEIDVLETETGERPHLRSAQRRLAEEFTRLVHGDRETEQVIAASQALFGRGELRELDESTLSAAMAEAPTGSVRLADGPTVVDLLVSSGLTPSRGAARRAVTEGGAYVNNVKVTDEAWQPAKEDLLHGRWLVVRRGKRNTAGVEVEA